MFKIIAWRLGFSFWNLVATFAKKTSLSLFQRYRKPVAYFAFGANLDPGVLEQRDVKAFSCAEFCLEDYDLVFQDPGPHEGAGFATIIPRPGKSVFGKIYTITAIDAIRLDYYEVLPFIRRHKRVTVFQSQERFYYYQSTIRREGLRPTEDYLYKIIRGTKTCDTVPREYLETLVNYETVKTPKFSENMNFIVQDYDCRPRFLYRVRKKYDRFCVQLFMQYFYPYNIPVRNAPK